MAADWTDIIISLLQPIILVMVMLFLGVAGTLVGELLYRITKNQRLKEAAQTFFQQRQIADSLVRRVEAMTAEAVKFGLRKFENPLQKMEWKSQAFIGMMLDKYPGISAQEADLLAKEALTRLEEGTKYFVGKAAEAAQAP